MTFKVGDWVRFRPSENSERAASALAPFVGKVINVYKENSNLLVRFKLLRSDGTLDPNYETNVDVVAVSMEKIDNKEVAQWHL